MKPLLVLALLGITATLWADDQLIVPPAGDYRLVTLVLEKAGPKNEDLLVRRATRDGKIPVASQLSHRDIIGELTVEPATIHGEYFFPGVAHAGAGMGAAPGKFRIEAKIAAGQVTGTWKLADKSGSVRGTITTAAELVKQNAFNTKAEWSSWAGPFTSMAATPCGLKLVEDFNKDARLVWRSEELVPRGPGNSLNYPELALVIDSNGGGSSLVVTGNRVFVNYYQPTGTNLLPGPVYWKGDPAYKPASPARFIDFITKKQGLNPSPFMLEKWAVKADDVVVCLDAVTGRTLWKNVFAGKSMNQPQHKGGAVNNTPCTGGGKVFAMGPGGTLHGIEIASGKVLWERTGMSAEAVAPWSGARNMCTAPIYAGDTLILPDHGASLRGIDPATGKDLWKLDGKSHRFQVPAKWSHQGKEYVLSLSSTDAKGALAQVHCLEPATGKIIWSLDLGASPSKGVLVHGDTMTAYINLEGTAAGGSVAVAGGAQCVAYRLNLTKPELLWQTPCPYVSLHTLPSNNGKYVVIGGVKESRMLDAATGKELATYTGSGPFNEGHVMFVEDRVLLSLDGSHGKSEMVVLGATPDTFAKALCTWNQPHPQTTSYHNKHMTWPAVEGRIFFRGTDGIYCYDLRRQP